MTIKSKKEYFQAIKLGYYNVDKQTKAPILDEFCATPDNLNFSTHF